LYLKSKEKKITSPEKTVKNLNRVREKYPFSQKTNGWFNTKDPMVGFEWGGRKRESLTQKSQMNLKRQV